MINIFCCGFFADLLSNAGLITVDVRARGGFEPDLLPVAWAVDAVRLEPEEEFLRTLQLAVDGRGAHVEEETTLDSSDARLP